MDIRDAKKVLYTVITDRYDFLFPPLVNQPGFDLVCFTDDDTLESDYYEIRPLPALPEIEKVSDDPIRKARLVKILAHRFLSDYDYSVYMDANRVIDDSLIEDIERFGGAILCFKGIFTDPYDAAQYYLEANDNTDPLQADPRAALPEAEKKLLKKQVSSWKKGGLKTNQGCPGTSLLGRWHNDEWVAKTMETWADEVIYGCYLDELSFPFACHKTKLQWVEGRSQFAQDNQLVSDAEEIAVLVAHKKHIVDENELTELSYPLNPPPPGGKYDGYPRLLTVGVPVSNQIETIRRCLDHLKPLLDAVESELVVVDTGSTDGTVEVCLEFGARVIKFPWIDNMSAARNQAILNAKGCWFMSIDDDEWFEDISPIIDFFTSGVYKNSLFAAYYQRNYMSKSRDDYFDYPAARMAKMQPSLHFEGRIHDLLTSENRNKKNNVITQILAFACHYGFAADDAVEQIPKTIRNLKNLKLDLVQFPYEPRHGYQVVREYQIARRYADAYRMALFTISLNLHHIRDEKIRTYNAIVVFMHNVMHSAGAWAQLIRFSDKYLDFEWNVEFDRCMVLYSLTYAAIGIKDYRKALEYITNYFKFRAVFTALPEDRQKPQTALTGTDRVDERRYIEMVSAGMLIDAILSRRSNLRKTMKSTEFITEFSESLLFRNFTVDLFSKRKDWISLSYLIDILKLKNECDAIPYILASVDIQAVSADIPHVREALRQSIETDHGFYDILELRRTAIEDDYFELYRKALAYVESVKYEAGSILRVSLLSEVFRLELDPSDVMQIMSIEHIDHLITRMGALDERTLLLYRSLSKWQETVGENSTPTEKYMALRIGNIVFNKSNKKDTDKYLTDFETLINRTYDWDTQLYRPEILKDFGSDLLPAGKQALCAAKTAFSLEHDENYADSLRAFRRALEKDNSLREPIKQLGARITKITERINKKQDAIVDEFSLLLGSVKTKINDMISSGHYSTALPLVAQLETLAPNDPDVKVLRKRINAYLQ